MYSCICKRHILSAGPLPGSVFIITLPRKTVTKIWEDITLPGKTVERLSEYRRTLLECLKAKKNFIYSHDLTACLHITAVQVRRDLMLIGYSSVQRKGYDIRELIDKIGTVIDSKESMNVTIIGIGNLGRAVAGYFKGKRSLKKLSVWELRGYLILLQSLLMYLPGSISKNMTWSLRWKKWPVLWKRTPFSITHAKWRFTEV